MIREQGTVDRVCGPRAVVRIARSSACASCGSRESCGEAMGKDMIVEVANDLGAREGDRIELGIPSGSFLALSFFVYLLPVAGLIGGAIAGGASGGALHLHPTAMSIVGAALGLGLSFWVLKRFDRLAKGRKELQPRITRIVRRRDIVFLEPFDTGPRLSRKP